MTTRNDLVITEELHQFLQGNIPNGYRIKEAEVPKLTADQAWTVVWYLGNLYWQVTDYIERCGVCGDLYDTQSEGTCLDYGGSPYHFCGACENGPEAEAKRTTEAAQAEEGKQDER